MKDLSKLIIGQMISANTIAGGSITVFGTTFDKFKYKDLLIVLHVKRSVNLKINFENIHIHHGSTESNLDSTPLPADFFINTDQSEIIEDVTRILTINMQCSAIKRFFTLSFFIEPMNGENSQTMSGIVCMMPIGIYPTDYQTTLLGTEIPLTEEYIQFPIAENSDGSDG